MAYRVTIKIILLQILLLAGCFLWAQDDPVLMTVNGRTVLRSEFAAYCNRERQAGKGGTLKELAARYAGQILKVKAAEDAGLDTLQEFKESVAAYRKRVAVAYLPGEEVIGHAAHQIYEGLKEAHRLERTKVSHIFKYIPQNVPGVRLRQLEAQMDSLYRVLKSGEASFEACVECCSDEKEPFWTGHLQAPVEFENVVAGVQVGEFSSPFLTPQGIHIVKVLERQDTPPFEAMRDSLEHIALCRFQTGANLDKLVEELKKKYGYLSDEQGVNELMTRGKTSRTLFWLNGHPYTGDRFTLFVAAHPGETKWQFAAFVTKSVLDYADSRLPQEYPAFARQLQACRDSLLLAAITRKEADERAATDQAGMQAYLEEHGSARRRERVLYQGAVLHGISKRVVKQARKFLKQLPEEEWQDAVRLTFNAGTAPQLQLEQGTFAPGDNAYVDELVFKGAKATPVPLFPFTAVVGKKKKQPEGDRELHLRWASGYRNYLEQRWTDRLHAIGKVEINQEVLKTVNNP